MGQRPAPGASQRADPKSKQIPFNSRVWKSESTKFGPFTRYFMLNDLRDHHLPAGLPKVRLERVLGRPDFHDHGRGWIPVYKLYRVRNQYVEHQPILRVYVGPQGELVRTEVGTMPEPFDRE